MENQECPAESRPRSPLAQLVARYFAWLNRQPVVVFTLVLAACSVLMQVVPMLLVGALHLAGISFPTTDFRPTLFEILVMAPLLETFLGQWLPIWVTARFTKKRSIQLVASAVLFSLLHLPDVQQTLQVAPGAAAMAYTYIVWRERGKHRGYWATALLHFWANGFAVLINLVI